MALGERSSPQPATAWMIASFETIFSTSREQHFEHRPFARRELQRLVPQESASGHRVELQRAVRDARPAVRLRAAQQRPHPRRELGHGEGLHHVVVGAQVEAAHAIVDRVARGEHQHRHRPAARGAGAQAAQHLEAVHLRQADVEDHQVELLLRRGEHRLLAARGDVDRVAFGLEDALQARGERRVVFNDQESHVVRRRSGINDTAALGCFSPRRTA